MIVNIGMCRHDGSTAFGTTKDHWMERVRTLSSMVTAVFPAFTPGELYVFLAPEYFFRKSAFRRPHGSTEDRRGSSAYMDGEYEAIKQGVAQIGEGQELVTIPGTVFWERRSAFWNSAPVIYRGATRFEYHKHEDAGELGSADATILTQETKFGRRAGFVPKPRAVEFMGGTEVGVCSVAGLQIGIEVCADHDRGTLATTDGIAPVDLHVIVANAVALVTDHVIARPGGHVLLCNACSRPQMDFQMQVAKVVATKSTMLGGKMRTVASRTEKVRHDASFTANDFCRRWRLTLP